VGNLINLLNYPEHRVITTFRVGRKAVAPGQCVLFPVLPEYFLRLIFTVTLASERVSWSWLCFHVVCWWTTQSNRL